MSEQRTWIQLGRAGDILTLLPILRAEPDRPALMVAEEYSGILDGVSYVDPVIYRGPHYEIGKAVSQAEAEGRKWTCVQINGPQPAVAEFVYKRAGQETARTTSFTKEQWKVAGMLNRWDECLPLEFDRRSPEREEKLCEVMKPGKKYVLAAVDGLSSPFPYKALLLELLKHCGYAVIDLATVRAERFYDLLALYERAYCLVAVDSAPLHLAWAVPTLPVMALANDTPMLWNGASWKPNHTWYCRYKDFPLRAVEMIEAIRAVRHKRESDGGGVLHVWGAYAGEKCEQPAEHWKPLPITVGACGRDSALILKDEKRLPFLRDSLRMAIQKAHADDWVCLTRPSTRFYPGAALELAKKDAAYAYRIVQNGEGQTFNPIGECFYAKREFWKKVLPDIPDLILGSDVFWAHALAALFRLRGAEDVTGSVYTEAKHGN